MRHLTDYDDIVDLCFALVRAEHLTSAEETYAYFAHPARYGDVFNVWCELGRPTDVKTKDGGWDAFLAWLDEVGKVHEVKELDVEDAKEPGDKKEKK